MARLVFLGRLGDMAGREVHDISAAVPLEWADLLGWIVASCSAGLADLIAGATVKVALNGALVGDKDAIVLRDGDEIAFLPPVSGG